MGQGLRMLCLHGYHGSGVILRHQMSSLAAALADRFAEPLVIKHAGGHVIPAGRAVTALIAEFLATFLQE